MDTCSFKGSTLAICPEIEHGEARYFLRLIQKVMGKTRLSGTLAFSKRKRRPTFAEVARLPAVVRAGLGRPVLEWMTLVCRLGGCHEVARGESEARTAVL